MRPIDETSRNMAPQAIGAGTGRDEFIVSHFVGKDRRRTIPVEFDGYVRQRRVRRQRENRAGDVVLHCHPKVLLCCTTRPARNIDGPAPTRRGVLCFEVYGIQLPCIRQHHGVFPVPLRSNRRDPFALAPDIDHRLSATPLTIGHYSRYHAEGGGVVPVAKRSKERSNGSFLEGESCSTMRLAGNSASAKVAILVYPSCRFDC